MNPPKLQNSFSVPTDPDIEDSSKRLENWAHKVVANSQMQSQKSRRNKIIDAKTESAVDKVVKEFEDRASKSKIVACLRDRTVNGPVKVAAIEGGYKWAMVDSGPGDHCAWAEDEFPEHEIEESEGQLNGQTMEPACKSILKNEGQFLVDFETQEGIKSNVTFHNVKVSTPILSVRQLIRKGHQVAFRVAGRLPQPKPEIKWTLSNEAESITSS